MATDSNFKIKNGLSIGDTEVIDSSGNLVNSSGSISGTTITGSDRGTFEDLVLTGDTDDDLTFTVASGDWSIKNSQQSNGLVIYDGTAGVQLLYNNTTKLQILDSGIDVQNGTISIAGTEFADASRNVTAGTIEGTSITGTSLDINGNATVSGYLNFDGGSQSGLIRFNGENAIGYSNEFLYINPTNHFTSGVYINSSLKVDTGLIGSYNEDLQLRTASTTALTLSNTDQSATFAGTVTLDNFVSVQGLDTGNPSASTDEIRVSGYGILGNRGTFYITNGGGGVQIGNGSSHNTSSTATFDTTGLNMSSGKTIRMNGSTKIDASGNLVNIGTINSGAITSSGSSQVANLTVTGDLTVQGTTTTLETATLNVEDKNITLNYGSGDTSGSANGAGITIQDAVNSTTDATILWNATNDRFEFSHDVDLPIEAAKIRFGGNTLGGPHGLIFYDDDGTSSFSMFYRTSPATITLEIEGDVAKHTFERDGSYTADGDINVGGLLTMAGGSANPISFMGTGSDANYRNFAYEASDHHYVTNRHTSGDLVLMSNNGTGGGETARITLKAGSGTQDIDISNANLDLNSNNINSIGTTTTTQLNLRGESIASGNLDTAGRGLYYWGSVQASTGSPGWNYGIAWTLQDTNQNIQLVFGGSGAGRLAVRRADSGTYYDWTHFYGEGTTITGDVSASYTQSSDTLTLTVADDSHNHVISNVDGLQTALDAKLPLAGGTMTGDINMNGNDITNIKYLQFENEELTDFTGAYQMLVDANDSDSDVATHGDFTGGYPFGIYFTGDGAGSTTTLGSGLVKVWHTGHFKKAHIDYFVGLYDTGVTTTEFDYLDGVTSNIQTQLNDKRADVGYEMGTVDLDTIINTGLFAQNSNSQATTATNYPTTTAGILEVKQDPGNNYHTSQTYYAYNNAGTGNNLIYNRYRYDTTAGGSGTGGWSDWVRMLKDDDTFSNSGGDVTVSGTYDALVLTVADDSHNHVISNVDGLQTALDTKYESGDNVSLGTIDLSGNLSINGTNVIQSSGNNLVNIGVVTATGLISTDSHVQSGDGSGGVALTINDGYGNANITWNHLSGVPEQNGNAARIEVNTDSTSGATMDFEVKSNVTSGTAVSLDHIMSVNETGLQMLAGHVIYSTGTLELLANDSDFVVSDTTDSITNFIWRDWSASKLYLGTSNAVATLRSTLDLNTENIINAGTISSGAITSTGTSQFDSLGVGISPAFAFHSYHATTNVVGRFESGDSQVWIDLHDSNSGTYGALLGHNSSQLFHVADSSVVDRLSLDNSGNLTVTGTVTASGGNSGNWNTAYGWGDHSTEGYLTDASTQTKYLRSDTSDTFSGGTLTIQAPGDGTGVFITKALDSPDEPAALVIASDADSEDDLAFEIRGNSTGSSVDLSTTMSSADTTFAVFANGHTTIGYNSLGTGYTPVNAYGLNVNGTISSVNGYYAGSTQVINSSGNWVGGGNISEFTNDSGYLTGITSSQVTTALGYTPYQEGTGLSASSGAFSGTITCTGNNMQMTNTQARVKYSVWSVNTYGIGLESGYTFGGIANNYVMSFQMSDTSDRGFWWGDSSHTNAQGAMALTTDGYLTVANGIRVGYGESDTTHPAAGLDVNGPVTFVQGLANDQTALTITQIDTSSDLSTQESFIDFTFIDANANNYPQVKIGAQVGQNADADSVIKEGSGAFVVYTNNATDSVAGGQSGMAERFRVDYRGYVGIGTSTPDAKLEVEGDVLIESTGSVGLTINADTDNVTETDVPFLSFKMDGATERLRMGVDSTNVPYISTDSDIELELKINTGTGNATRAIFGQPSTSNASLEVYGDSGTNTWIQTWHGDSDSMAMRSIGTGDYSLRNTQQNNGLNFYDGTGGVEIIYNNVTVLEADSDGGIKVTGNLSATGNVTAYSSDERLKNIHGVIDNPLEKLSKLSGYYFEWNKIANEFGQGYEAGERHVGVKAQEVQKVLPEVVKASPVNNRFNTDEEYLTVQYDKIVPLLIEAIKEQQKQIDDLKTEINNLKGEK